MSAYDTGNQSTADAAAEADTDADGARIAYLDQALWKNFVDAADSETFAVAWLTLQCSMIVGVVRGSVVLGPPDKGPFTPAAVWPVGQSISSGLSGVAESAMRERRGVLNKARNKDSTAPAARYVHVAYPVLMDTQLYGVIALEISAMPDSELRGVMRQLQWGAGWLEVLLRRNAQQGGASSQQHLTQAIEITATGLEHARFQPAATAVVTELATRLGCDRVSVGMRKKNHTRVQAMSHSAQIDKQTNLARAIGAAMDEALDQYATLVYPGVADEAGLVTRAHAALSATGDAQAICTVPLVEDDKIVGALTFERTAGPFDEQMLGLFKQLAVLIGPILSSKYREDRPLVAKIAAAMNAALAKLIGPRHFTAKLVVGVLLALVVFFSVADDDYRISADATLEGSIQRVVVAPIAGYIVDAKARAGDIVEKGALLVTVDDRDLRLEYLKWSSEKEQLLRQYQDSLSQHKRSEVGVLKAKLDQADAQLELVQDQISRTRVVAPFGGIVVSGDLSQQLGAPVERGQILLEIAPLDSYRIILRVDERDISQLTIGLPGELILSAMPARVFAFTVEKITPVSIAEEGQNTFRVEARLVGDSALLRPGMQGTGKVTVDRRKLIWIWSHRITEWLHLWLWSWLP